MAMFQVTKKTISSIEGSGIIKIYKVGDKIELGEEQAKAFKDRIIRVENGVPVVPVVKPSKPTVEMKGKPLLKTEGPGARLRQEAAEAEAAEAAEAEEQAGSVEVEDDEVEAETAPKEEALPETLDDLSVRKAMDLIKSIDDTSILRAWSNDSRGTIQSTIARRLRVLAEE